MTTTTRFDNTRDGAALLRAVFRHDSEGFDVIVDNHEDLRLLVGATASAAVAALLAFYRVEEVDALLGLVADAATRADLEHINTNNQKEDTE